MSQQTTEGKSRQSTEQAVAPAHLENVGRRKVVKTMVGGAATLAAYNLLPARWGAPYIESIFLPAHAATSGETDSVIGTWNIDGSSGQYMTFYANGRMTYTDEDGADDTTEGTYSISGTTISMTFAISDNDPDPASAGTTVTGEGTISDDYTTISGTMTSAGESEAFSLTKA